MPSGANKRGFKELLTSFLPVKINGLVAHPPPS